MIEVFFEGETAKGVFGRSVCRCRLMCPAAGGKKKSGDGEIRLSVKNSVAKTFGRETASRNVAKEGTGEEEKIVQRSHLRSKIPLPPKKRRSTAEKG